MAYMYAYLIMRGRKTFAAVPDKLKDAVKQALIDLDCEHLITEE